MQEPLNFSRTTAYSASQELAVRLLNSLKSNNYGATNNSTLDFDLRAATHTRDGLNGGAGGVDSEQMPNSLLSHHWAALPSTVFLAAAAAAAISMKSTPTNNFSGRHRETIGLKSSPGADVHSDLEKSISNHTGLASEVIESNMPQTHPPTDISTNQTVETSICTPPQLNKRNSKPGEHARRSRVVIHQFGDAEDHFSKALRDLHVKSAGEYEMTSRAAQQKHVWTFDDVGGRVEASVVSPSFEAQNIADLAVEKHFEKSLATFHAKQAAAAAKTSTTANSSNATRSKDSLDLSIPRNQPPFSPSSTTSSSSSSSANSSSDGSLLLSPREESGGPSFNPKKKWLAQYDDDEGARIRVRRKSGTRSLDENSWNSKSTTSSNSIEKRSRSCPLLLNERKCSAEAHFDCRNKCETSFNNETKRLELSQDEAAQSSMASLQLSQRGFSTLVRTISLEVPSLGNSIGFFEDEDEAEMASKSISARDSPVSSPIAASSGFFTDSTYSLDSSTLPVISGAGYFSSNASVSSSFNTKHLAALRENSTTMGQKERSYFACESEDVAEANVMSPHGRCWALRKRTASDTSNLSCLKRSRSVVETGSGEHS